MHVESLETRRLLAASLSRGTLSITGSADDDSISIGPKSSKLVVRIPTEGLTQSFRASAVRRISIDAGAGSDSALVDSRVTVPVTLLGGAGNDTLTGGSGDDTFDGGAGADTFDGKAGRDEVLYRSRRAGITVTMDAAANDGEEGENDNILNSIDVVVGGRGHDTLRADGLAAGMYFDGFLGDDLLIGGGGNDTLIGHDGDDTIDGGLGADDISGSDGLDTATYASRTNPVSLSLDNRVNDGEEGELDKIDDTIDTLIGGSGNDRITGVRGDFGKRLEGGAGNDTITSFQSADLIFGGDGGDRVFGGGGADRVYGEDGNDKITAGDGGDRIEGGPGNDSLYGEAFDDTLVGGPGADLFDGGKNTDTVLYNYTSEDLTVTIDGVADDGAAGENDNVRTNVEWLYGGGGDDTLSGSSAANRIRGGAGDDVITGGRGRDRLYGDAGNDTLRARDGLADILDGGAGTNTAEADDIDSLANVL